MKVSAVFSLLYWTSHVIGLAGVDQKAKGVGSCKFRRNRIGKSVIKIENATHATAINNSETIIHFNGQGIPGSALGQRQNVVGTVGYIYQKMSDASYLCHFFLIKTKNSNMKRYHFWNNGLHYVNSFPKKNPFLQLFLNSCSNNSFILLSRLVNQR